MIPVINHTALYVRDLQGVKTFYETYFGGVASHEYHNPRTGLRTYFLSFGEGSRLELMTRPGYEVTAPAERAGWAHLSFGVGSPEAVDQLADRFIADGYAITNGPRTTGDGYYEACVLDPEGNPVEFVA